MALSKRIWIRNRIFKSTDIEELIKTVSSYYLENSETPNFYSLEISADPHTTTAFDKPPSTYDGLAAGRILSISLTIQTYTPKRRIQLEMNHGDRHSFIIITGPDADWVNSAYAILSEKLETAQPQSRFFVDHAFAIALSTGWLLGWPIMRAIMFMNSIPWKAQPLFPRLFCSEAYGFVMIIMAKKLWIDDAYPPVEIQTGPAHFWKEASTRRWIKIIGSVLLLGPSANFLYDVYKSIAGQP